MINFKERVLLQLKEKGFKLTGPRMQVVDFLEKAEIAYTPYEIRDFLAKEGVKADVVTIYRVLEVLEEIGLVHKVNSIGRFSKCNIEDDKHLCHHYLVCEKCNRVLEFEGEDLEGLEDKIAKKTGFKISSHYLEFRGICSKCESK